MNFPRLIQPSHQKKDELDRAHAETVEKYDQLISQAEILTDEMKDLAKKALNGSADAKQQGKKSQVS